MTHIAFTSARTARPSFAEQVARFRADEPRFFDLAILCGLLMLPTGFAAVADNRLFDGVDIWIKPLKFDVALLVYFLTMVFFARFLPATTRSSRTYRIYSVAVVTAVALEVAWIHGAAALGTASHFNASPVGAVLYSVAGLGALMLTTPPAVYAVSIYRNPPTGLPPVLSESLVLGLGLTLPLTLMTAGTMANLGQHYVGGVPADPSGLFFFGWARDVGDLRVAHFFATHAMHAVPLFGLAYVGLAGGTSRWPARIFAAGFTGFVIFAFVQALNGQPFLPALG
ncbi:MAG: hypothetical protein KF723_17300 [Rhizobiaceae bacterium]|nr:hypothetical protein [Rhizobiaceae bacterium]